MFFGLGLVVGLVLCAGHPAWAEEQPGMSQQGESASVAAQIATKFARGCVNLTTGWVEFPKQIYLVGKNEGWVIGAIRGPVDGLGMFVARTVAGVYELLTFPVPIPPQYQPMVTPKYVWQPEPGNPEVHSHQAESGAVADSQARPSSAP